jgi:hypothetical protein
MPPTAPAPADKSGTKSDSDGDGEPSEITKLRKENASWRTKLREQAAATATATQTATDRESEAARLLEVVASLNAILNPDADAPADPAQLAETQAQRDRDVADRDTQIRSLTIRAALPSVFAKASADPGLTEAVLTASGALGKLDPASDTFTADLESAVAAAMDSNPRLKVTPAVARSGSEIPGRSGASDQLTLEQVRAMKPEQIEEARKAGKLRSLLGGK